MGMCLSPILGLRNQLGPFVSKSSVLQSTFVTCRVFIKGFVLVGNRIRVFLGWGGHGWNCASCFVIHRCPALSRVPRCFGVYCISIRYCFLCWSNCCRFLAWYSALVLWRMYRLCCVHAPIWAKEFSPRGKGEIRAGGGEHCQY